MREMIFLDWISKSSHSLNWLWGGRVCVQDWRGLGLNEMFLFQVSNLEIPLLSTAGVVRSDVEICGGLVKVHCLFWGMNCTSCSICNGNTLEIIHINNNWIIVYNWMHSAGLWLELGNLGRMRNRKRNTGLSVRCVVLTELLFHGSEPKKKRFWSGEVHGLATQICSSGFCTAGRTGFCFVPALGAWENTFVPPSCEVPPPFLRTKVSCEPFPVFIFNWFLG